MRSFVQSSGPIVCLDIGQSQDGLLALPERAPEDWPEIRLPLGAEENAWQHECAQCGYPRPEAVLLCLEDDPAWQNWRAFWQARMEFFAAHTVGGAQMFAENAVDAVAEQVSSRTVWRTPSALAALRGLLLEPKFAARTHRQGLVVLYAGRQRTTALLVFKERIYGVYEHVGDYGPERIKDDLKEFKLGWLPDELVRLAGGYGCILAHPIPEEAESFETVYITGPAQSVFAGQGQMVGDAVSGTRMRCFGLLHGRVQGVSME